MGNASAILDSTTREAIQSLNLLDVDLYSYAKQIYKAQSECAKQSSALQKANTAGRVTSHGNAATRKCFEGVRVRFQTSLSWQLVAGLAKQQQIRRSRGVNGSGADGQR